MIFLRHIDVLNYDVTRRQVFVDSIITVIYYINSGCCDVYVVVTLMIPSKHNSPFKWNLTSVLMFKAEGFYYIQWMSDGLVPWCLGHYLSSDLFSEFSHSSN